MSGVKTNTIVLTFDTNARFGWSIWTPVGTADYLCPDEALGTVAGILLSGEVRYLDTEEQRKARFIAEHERSKEQAAERETEREAQIKSRKEEVERIERTAIAKYKMSLKKKGAR